MLHVDLLNDVMIVVSALVDLNKSVFSKWKWTTTWKLFTFITFTVAVLNIFLNRSHTVAKDESFLYELQEYKKNKKQKTKKQ